MSHREHQVYYASQYSIGFLDRAEGPLESVKPFLHKQNKKAFQNSQEKSSSSQVQIILMLQLLHSEGIHVKHMWNMWMHSTDSPYCVESKDDGKVMW